MDPTQDSPDLDPTAAISQPAAEMHEGAPAFSDAPELDAAPEDQAEPEINWRAKYEAAQQETVAERRQREALEAQQQQLLAAAGQAAWEKEAEDAQKHANTLDYEQATAYLNTFYRNREARIMAQAQQTTHAFALNKFADEVVSYWGLEPTDRIRLGSDPNQMNAIAESIVAERSKVSSEVAQLRKELTQLKRSQQAQQALANPAYRQGGTRPNGAPGKPVDPNDLSQWAEQLYGILPSQPRR